MNSADPQRMAAVYRSLAEQAAATLTAFEEELDWMRAEGYDDTTHPKFGNYAVLRFGVESQRVMREWTSWLASRL
ncbi:virulence activator alpha [Micromonospora pisi]|uniref:Virulence activator alpha n=1 Tax=Micromonospora pisi TaxID=589240 RepID=A0A495JP83_9ACTN|nr:virulence activator alpha [Micromonospora pisi]